MLELTRVPFDGAAMQGAMRIKYPEAIEQARGVNS